MALVEKANTPGNFKRKNVSLKLLEILEKIKKILITLGWIRTHAHRYRDHGMKENIRRFNDLDCKS